MKVKLLHLRKFIISRLINKINRITKERDFYKEKVEFLSNEKEKKFVYFIMSHSINGEFCWPMLPDPTMGEEFINKVKKEHEEIGNWIRENPFKFDLATKGYYYKFYNLNKK